MKNYFVEQIEKATAIAKLNIANKHYSNLSDKELEKIVNDFLKMNQSVIEVNIKHKDMTVNFNDANDFIYVDAVDNAIVVVLYRQEIDYIVVEE